MSDTHKLLLHESPVFREMSLLEDSIYMGVLPPRWNRIIQKIKKHIFELEQENRKLKDMSRLDDFDEKNDNPNERRDE